MNIKFCLESHIPLRFREKIIRAGYAAIAAPLHVPDERVMSASKSYDAPLITHDVLDFLVLAATTSSYPGLIFPPIYGGQFRDAQFDRVETAFLQWLSVRPSISFAGKITVITRKSDIIIFPFDAANVNQPHIPDILGRKKPERKLPFESAIRYWQKLIRDVQAGR